MLRKGPQHLPALEFLVYVAALLHVAVSLVQAGMTSQGLYVAGVSEFLYFVTLYALVWALLRFTGHSARLNATLSALIGSGAIISAVALPVLLWVRAPATPEDIGSAQLLLIVAVSVWNIAVMGNVLRMASGLSRLAAAAIAVAYSLTYIKLFLAVFTLPS